jgi:hypothetical protein
VSFAEKEQLSGNNRLSPIKQHGKVQPAAYQQLGLCSAWLVHLISTDGAGARIT